MKKIGIIGASGMAGSEIYKLASKDPDLEVTGIVRNKKKAEKILGPGANLIIGDIFTMNDSLLKKFDIIVDAFGTTPEHADKQVTLAEKLVSLASRNKIKLIFILGAGSLHTGADQHLVIEDIAQAPDSDSWINIPRQQLRELEYLRGINEVDWMGISPSMEFEPGSSQTYVIGGNELLFNSKGDSTVTAGTMATVVVNEIKENKHHRERITVVNA